MRPLMRLRSIFTILAVLTALFVAGCGGGDDDGSSDSADLSSVVPAQAPVFLELTIQPQGKPKRNLENLLTTVGAIPDAGERIIFEIEKEIGEKGEDFRFEKDVLPWLGRRAGIFMREYDGEDFKSVGVAIETTDEDAARDFVDGQLEAQEEPPEEGSYEGVDFKVEAEDDTVIGVFDGLVVLAQDEATFESMVDASEGDSLADAEEFTTATAEIPDESVADIYVDIGGLIKEVGKGIDSETRVFLDSVGIEPDEATAVASLVPGFQLVEVVFSSNLSGEKPPAAGDASELLGSLPADSLAAFAASEFGERFMEGIDQIDEEGIPGEVPPNQLKKTLKEAGIDLDSIGNSIGDVAGFVKGNSESSLTGALVMRTDNPQQARNTVSSIGLFLRSAGIPGVSAVKGGAAGFSVRSPDLGPNPLVVVAKGPRIAIGYGLQATLSAFNPSGSTLSGFRPFTAGQEVLGDTPMVAYVNGPEATKLAVSLGLIPNETGKGKPLPYLRKISYMVLGSEASGDRAIARLIVGLSFQATK